jgi:RHS repeat-associated protein
MRKITILYFIVTLFIGISLYSQNKTPKQQGGSTAQVKTEKTYLYTKFGNVKEYRDQGNVNITGDEVQANISYKYDTIDRYLVSLPETVTITTNGTNQLRKRTATYTPEGALASLTLFGSNGNALYNYTYDIYGNTLSVTNPSNVNGERMQINYQYDTEVHTYPIQASNSFGYTSTAQYNYKFGKPLETVDISGNKMQYTYDRRGRISTILAPKEIDAGRPYTIKYDYWDLHKYYLVKIASWNQYIGQQRILYAKTSHFDQDNVATSNNIEIITFVDGLGRPIQIKKDVEINGTEKIVNTGWVYYDQLGRKTSQYQLLLDTITTSPITLNINGYLFGNGYAQFSGPGECIINNTLNTNPPTTISYDILDRPTKTINPDQTQSENTYSFGADAWNHQSFLTTLKDENSNNSYIFTDARQLKTTVIDALDNTTKFKYDEMGQLTQSIDPETYTTSYTYDMLGRLMTRNHPSAGLTTYSYDNASNMLMQTFSSGETMSYEYDYNRPIAIHYSINPWNDVKYEYGGAGNGNETGKLIRQQDASGVQEFKYGNMGEVLGNTHSYVLPYNDAVTLKTLWEYDSWNRVKQITYPDGEVLDYNYNKGGMLKSITGIKAGLPNTYYIQSIKYDEYEQRIKETYGNQVITNYTYDPLTRRLDSLQSYSSLQQLQLQRNKYKYDNVGNILQIRATGHDTYTHDYEYDPTYRLSTANGSGTWNGTNLSYGTSMVYSPSGRIEQKDMASQRLSNQQSQYGVNYNNEYSYGYNNNPYALKRIQDPNTGEIDDFEWDLKGNMTRHYGKDRKQYLCWTEDNRLEAFMDDKENAAYYSYDASGDRTLKYTGSVTQITQNGQTYNHPYLYSTTLYAGALITINKSGYTKHYFEEGKRICSKIGGGFSNALQPFDDHLKDLDYGKQLAGINNTYQNCMGTTVDLNDYEYNVYNAMKNEETRNATESPFYYLSDHLGSSSYITNSFGVITQTLGYLPYGEEWVDIDNQPPYLTPYKFSGKEKDEESGFNYFGSRYYWDKGSIWLSVDPMSHKYPHLTSYNYCANNPVMLIDPNGEEIFTAHLEKHGTKEQKTAFNAFARTKGGIAELSKYAKKGQTIAGHTYTGNGKYHNKGIDLSFMGGELSDRTRSGETGVEFNKGRLNITIAVDPNTNAGIGSRVESYIHELFIHADQDSRDYIDNGKIDYSHVYNRLKPYAKNGSAYMQHYQELNKEHRMENKGIPILNEYYKGKKSISDLRKMIEFVP